MNTENRGLPLGGEGAQHDPEVGERIMTLYDEFFPNGIEDRSVKRWTVHTTEDADFPVDEAQRRALLFHLEHRVLVDTDPNETLPRRRLRDLIRFRKVIPQKTQDRPDILIYKEDEEWDSILRERIDSLTAEGVTRRLRITIQHLNRQHTWPRNKYSLARE